MERFIRRENVKHFEEMLARAKTDGERSRLTKLLAEERQKQMEAGDFEKQTDKPL
ncbi:hypothetical protein [Rhodoplanes sp. Z2-YC6860]|uniref:hypothetical protein n=1 Tax=Rhodoplanes sp. Z2-YC6860 TaxID=674703 RepID=UPI0012ECDB28|nr:hypothetical protein [Rhodoplanes sp. Z2-YC6860]